MRIAKLYTLNFFRRRGWQASWTMYGDVVVHQRMTRVRVSASPAQLYKFPLQPTHARRLARKP